MPETPARKYKVLMLAACPFPANYGTPGCIKEMCEVMTERGHDIHIVTHPYGDDTPVKNLKLYRTPHFGWSKKITVGPTLQRPLFAFLMVFLAIRVVWKQRCEVIHSHNHEGQLVGICVHLLTGRPLLYNAVTTMKSELATYNVIKPEFVARWLALFLDWIVPRISNHILTLTPDLKEIMIKEGIPEKKITIVPAGIFPEMFTEANPHRFRQQLGLIGKKVILYAGTLDPMQRVDTLIEAFGLLAPVRPDTLLLIVSPFSKKEPKATLENLAKQLEILDRVQFVDGHSLVDLPDYLALADVAAAPRPRCPGHPIKLLNYMAASLPIIVAEGGAKGIRHLDNGFIFRNDDTRHFAEGISLLLDDRILAGNLGRQARQTILNEYDWRVLSKKIEEIYADML